MTAWVQIPVRFQETHVYIDHRAGESVTAAAGGEATSARYCRLQFKYASLGLDNLSVELIIR